VLPRPLVNDPRQLAAEASLLLAEPDLAHRRLEDVAERARLQDAAGRDHAGRAHDERVPAGEARLVESHDLAVDFLQPGNVAWRWIFCTSGTSRG
jgi:hypothetical protein